MNQAIINSLGKRAAKMFRDGTLSETQVMRYYKQNKAEVDGFMFSQYTDQELFHISKETHNVLLRNEIQKVLAKRKEVDLRVKEQNAENQRILKERLVNAINGMSLRQVKARLKKMFKARKEDLELEAACLLLDLEHSNLAAKTAAGNDRKHMYEHKSRLIQRLHPILRRLGWRYGVSDSPGKRAQYIVYCYLGTTNEQVSWHANEFSIRQALPYIDCMWDGKCASTLIKILDYIKLRFFGQEPAMVPAAA